MENPGESILSDDTRVYTKIENEFGSSDDSEVSVANLNRHSNKEIIAENVSDDEDVSYIANVESDNEIVSDDEYVYSEDSVYSDESCKDSDITDVTPRSSLSTGSPLQRGASAEYPTIRHRLREMALQEDPSRRERFINVGKIRMCSSADDSRCLISNELRTGSFPVINKRRNMSFTNDEMRKIELENQNLLRKIMAQQKPQIKLTRVLSAKPKQSNSAIHRRKLQERIDYENMILLRRIQEAKPCTGTRITIPGYKFTSQ